MSKPEPTPIPWRVGKPDQNAQPGTIASIYALDHEYPDAGEWVIADVAGGPHHGDSPDDGLANAERIVRAVNAHADLLAACEAIDALDCCTGYSFPDSEWPLFWEALEKARAAINKAKGI